MSAEGHEIAGQVVKDESAEVMREERLQKSESADRLSLTAGVGHCCNPTTCELKEFDSRPR